MRTHHMAVSSTIACSLQNQAAVTDRACIDLSPRHLAITGTIEPGDRLRVTYPEDLTFCRPITLYLIERAVARNADTIALELRVMHPEVWALIDRVDALERHIDQQRRIPMNDDPPQEREPMLFQPGDRVRKVKGSYQTTGVIAAAWYESDPVPRYVFRFDNPPGVLFIFNQSQLQPITTDEPRIPRSADT